MMEFEQKVLEDLSALKVQMLEQRVDCHERSMQRLQGISGAFGGALGLVQLVFFVLRSRH